MNFAYVACCYNNARFLGVNRHGREAWMHESHDILQRIMQNSIVHAKKCMIPAKKYYLNEVIFTCG